MWRNTLKCSFDQLLCYKRNLCRIYQLGILLLPLYCLVFLDVCTVFYLLKESNNFRMTKCVAGYFAKLNQCILTLR